MVVGSEVGWHGGKAAIRRPRVRERGDAELELPSWTAIQKADLLSRWAFNQMLIGVATRKYARSIRLPDGDLAGQAMCATTKSSVSRRFVALSTAKLSCQRPSSHGGQTPALGLGEVALLLRGSF